MSSATEQQTSKGRGRRRRFRFAEVEPSGSLLGAAWAQLLFLDCVAELAPTVLDALGRAPRREFRRVWRDPGVRQVLAWEHVGRASERVLPELASLRRALEAWGERSRLSEPWCFDAALSALAYSGAKPVRWMHGGPVSSGFIAEPFAFRGSKYRVNSETRREAAKRISGEFTAALATYLNQVEEEAFETGGRYVRAAPCEEHFQWLVRYQILGRSFTEIARQALPANPEESGRKAIAKGVRGLATIIGLSLRPAPKGGRPAKRLTRTFCASEARPPG